MRKAILLIVMILLCMPRISGKEAGAISIHVAGDWAEVIDTADLQAGPGSDLSPTYTSDNQQVNITIRKTKLPWVLNVNKGDTNWHADFQLKIRRTSDGNGPGFVSGGTAWTPITHVPSQFFAGERQRMDIGAQLQVTGVSVQIPAGIYTTTVYYTIVEQ